jgi:hypothetical protein
VICFSCAEQKSTNVDVYGVSFTCPSGWKVSETEDYGTAKYISIEKKGVNSSGLVTMSFTEEDYELEEYLQLFQESFLEQKVLKNLVFQKANEANYGKYKGIVSNFTFETMSIKHVGKMCIFQKNGITMCLVNQEAVEDHKQNLLGFETIEESFNIKQTLN